MPLLCPCCNNEMSGDRVTGLLRVFQCPECGHRCADHPSNPPAADYHAQYDQGAFTKSLEETRRRQARVILAALKRHDIPSENLLDFGAGRGWFVEEAKKSGAHFLAGADTSSLSLEALRALGVQTATIKIEKESFKIDTTRLNFEPVTLTLLDVIEHFPPKEIERYLRAVLAQLPKIRWVVIKVPISDGILFQLARLLAFFGWTKPYLQLFQVGTFPPHFHYFSKTSLELFLSKLNMRALAVIDDADMDDVLARANTTREPGGMLSHVLTKILVLLGMATSQDSRIVIAEYGAVVPAQSIKSWSGILGTRVTS